MTGVDSTGMIPDGDLVQAARAGDERAFGTLVERHHAGVYRLALSFVSDTDTAQDVAQDTFLKAFRALDGYRGDAPFRSWLFTIAANEAKAQLRRRVRRKETALDDAGPVAGDEASPADAAVVTDEAERARRVLATLPEKQRLSVTLRIDEGLSFREIGALIGSSEGAARVNYFHGIRRLREMLS